MRLTGIPLILIAGGLGGAALIATVALWSRGGRRRLVTRTVGALCTEVLLLTTIALVWNRDQSFYPSWSDLSGDPKAAAPLRPAPSPVPWRGPGQLVVPPGYAAHPDLSYPVLVVLCGPADLAAVRAEAANVPDAVTVVLTPAPTAAASTLTGLLGELGRSARVADHDWALVTDRPHREIASRLHDADPRFGAEPEVAVPLAGVADRLPAPLVETVSR